MSGELPWWGIPGAGIIGDEARYRSPSARATALCRSSRSTLYFLWGEVNYDSDGDCGTPHRPRLVRPLPGEPGQRAAD